MSSQMERTGRLRWRSKADYLLVCACLSANANSVYTFAHYVDEYGGERYTIQLALPRRGILGIITSICPDLSTPVYIFWLPPLSDLWSSGPKKPCTRATSLTLHGLGHYHCNTGIRFHLFFLQKFVLYDRNLIRFL